MPTARSNRRQTISSVNHRAVLDSNSHNAAAPPRDPNSSKNGASNNDSNNNNQKPRRKSRMSMIPRVGRENLVPPPSPGLVAPTAASRRRSVAGGRRQTLGGGASQSPPRNHLPPSGAASSTVVKQDPRPIHDKAFQQDGIRRLQHFLMTNGYDYPISQKSLARPSGKDFSNICTFLLRQVDPNFQEPYGANNNKDNVAMKFEDEVAMNFKALGYPFPISKTALVAAGSPHTWPTLLAALTWLVDLLEIMKFDIPDDMDIKASKPFETLEELEMTTDKVFFQYLQQAYTAFLQGDEPLQHQLENDLADRFEVDDGFIEQEVERVTDLNAAMVEQMNHMVTETRDFLTVLLYNYYSLPAMMKKRDDYTTDLEQFHDLIRQMDDHIATLNTKVLERTEELAKTNEKLGKMNGHITNLKATLDQQAASVGDMCKLQSELKGADEAMGRAEARKEKLRKAQWESETQLADLYTQLESLISEFNASLGDVALLPGMDEERVARMKVVLDKTQALQKDTTKLLGVDLASEVDPSLEHYKRMYIESTANAQERYQAALDQLESSQENLAELTEKLETVEASKVKSEHALDNEKETLEAKLAVKLREVETVESSVSSIGDPVALEEQMAKYEGQCAELEALRLQQQEDNLTKKKAVESEIDAACQAILTLEQLCKAKAAEANQYWLMKLTQNTGKVNVPVEMLSSQDSD